jgi:hypothetical protein
MQARDTGRSKPEVLSREVRLPGSRVSGECDSWLAPQDGWDGSFGGARRLCYTRPWIRDEYGRAAGGGTAGPPRVKSSHPLRFAIA